MQHILLDDPEFLRKIVERALRQILEADIAEHIGAAPYERTENRKGHRDGYKPRKLKTRVSAPSTSSCLRIGRAPSPAGFSPATSATRRRSFWP